MSDFSGKIVGHKENILEIIRSSNKNIQSQFNLNTSVGLSLNCRSRELENIENHNDTSLTITVYDDHRKGTASTNNLSKDSIKKAFEKASNIARNTQRDTCQGLPKEHIIRDVKQDLDIYHPISPEINEIIDITKKCEAAGFDFDKKITNSEGSSFSMSENECMIINSEDMFGYYRSTDYSLSCIMLAQQGKSMERDYWYSSTRDFENLEDAESIGEEAARRAVSRLNAKTISSRVCPIIFPAEIASSFFNTFLSAINGHSIYKKSSFLVEKLGCELFPKFLTIREDPCVANANGTRPFDSDGVMTSKKTIIDNGTLKTYLLDTYSARKLNQECTGNGVITNIIVESVEDQPSNLLSHVDEGIIITEMMGSGANLLTGDYSRGASGFYFKNGEVKYPVNGITVASNLSEMFKNIIHIGDDYDTRGNIHTGSVLIDKMTIGGC